MRNTANFGLKKPDLADDYTMEDITGDMNTVRKLLGQQNIMGPTGTITGGTNGAGVMDNVRSDWNLVTAYVYRHRSGQIAIKIIFTSVAARTVDSRGYISGNQTIGVVLPEFYPMSTIAMRTWASGRSVRGYLASSGAIVLSNVASYEMTFPAGQNVELMSDWFYPASVIGQVSDIRIPNGGESFDGSALDASWKKIESYEAKSPVFAKNTVDIVAIASPTSPDTYGVLATTPNGTQDYRTTLNNGAFTFKVVGDRLYFAASIKRVKTSANLPISSSGDISNQNMFEVTPALIAEINSQCGTSFTGIRMGGLAYWRVSFNNNFRADFIINGSSNGSGVFSPAVELSTTTSVSFNYTCPDSMVGMMDGWMLLA